MTDAAELRAKVDALKEKVQEFHNLMLTITGMVDDMKFQVVDLGGETPMVIPLLVSATDNLRTANHQVGQANDLVTRWSKFL